MGRHLLTCFLWGISLWPGSNGSTHCHVGSRRNPGAPHPLDPALVQEEIWEEVRHLNAGSLRKLTHNQEYKIKNGKQEQYFFTDEDFDKVRKTIRGEINRAKGLGALSVEQAHNSMFTENYQRLDILHPTENAIQLLYNLMGSDSSLRKEFIFNNVDFSQLRE